MFASQDVALFRHVPGLIDRIPWVRLGQWPTPVERLDNLPGARVPVYVKREDRSSPAYGGNKVRTLESLLGQARAAGATCIWATGAYGSNHGIATVVHALRAGFDAGVALFPQPPSTPARANLLAMLSFGPHIQPMPMVVALPLIMAYLRRRKGAYVMAPGGATPQGALGAFSAGLELAEQIQAGVCPLPARIVIAVGSACTTAGLLAGLHMAGALGMGFDLGSVPAITAVRVTPWPVTSRARIARLALQTSRYVAALAGAPAAGFARLYAALEVDSRYFGGGYGQVTASGYRAMHAFARAGGPPLDIVYSAKSGAALLDRAAAGAKGPLLFWATKSSAPLACASPADVARAPRAWRAWLGASP